MKNKTKEQIFKESIITDLLNELNLRGTEIRDLENEIKILNERLDEKQKKEDLLIVAISGFDIYVSSILPIVEKGNFQNRCKETWKSILNLTQPKDAGHLS